MVHGEKNPSIQTVTTLMNTRARWERKHGREPSVEELAAEMQVPIDDMHRLIEATRNPITFRRTGTAGSG